jgi:hypothetical protein
MIRRSRSFRRADESLRTRPFGRWWRWWRWLPVLAWMGVITFWSSRSDLPIDRGVIAYLFAGQQHSLAHASAFGILAVLVRWAVEGTPGATLWAFLFSTMFGAVDEWHQSFTPRREPDLRDLAIDAMAAALACMVTDACLQIWRAWRAGQWHPSSFAVPAGAFLVTAVIAYSLLPPSLLPSAATGRRVLNVAARALPDPAEAHVRKWAQGTVWTARALRAELRDLARVGT